MILLRGNRQGSEATLNATDRDIEDVEETLDFADGQWRIYKRCNLSPEYHLHTLRHYFAIYLLQQGTSKQVAADLLGHGDTAFLERTYCHPQDTCKEEAAGLLDSLLTPMEDHEWTPPPLTMEKPITIQKPATSAELEALRKQFEARYGALVG